MEAFQAHRHIQDVSRAWHSLTEAKHTLQRIESEVGAGGRCRQEQRARRRPRLEEDSEAPGPGYRRSEEERLIAGPGYRRSEEERLIAGLGYRRSEEERVIAGPGYRRSEEERPQKSEQTFTLCSKDLSSPLRPFGSPSERQLILCPERTNLYLTTHHRPGGGIETHNLDSSLNLHLRFGSGTMEEGLQRPTWSPQPINPDEEELVVNPYPAVTVPLSILNVQGALTSPETLTPLLSPKTDLYAQKLEFLKQRSPSKKLERLKEKIREQRRRQDKLKRNLAKADRSPELTRRSANVQKMRKVTRGPAAPVYKGFSASRREEIPAEKENVTRSHHRPERSHPEESRSTKEKAMSPKCRKMASELSERKNSSESCRKRMQKVGFRDPLKSQESAEGRAMLRVLRDIQAGRGASGDLAGTLEKSAVKYTSRPRNVSPKRARCGALSPGSEGLESGKARSYSVEEVRSFMRKRKVERIKAERASRRKTQKALQTRQQQLHDVLEKQREAFPPKRASSNPAAQPRVAAQLGPTRRQLSDWLHLTSSDLLREEHGGRELRAQVTEDRYSHDCTSPLQLQDLTPTPTIPRQDPTPTPTIPRLELTPTPTIPRQDPQAYDYSKEGSRLDGPSPQQSPCRESRERVQALLATAKDLGRKVELEMNRLGTIHPARHFTTLPSPNSPTQAGSLASQPMEAKKRHGGNIAKTKTTSASAAVSANIDLPPTATGATPIEGKMKIHLEKNSQTQFNNRATHQPGLTTTRSPHRGSERHSAKITAKTTSLTQDGVKQDKKGGSAPLHHGKPGAQVCDWRQTRAEITDRIKGRLEQQEKDLARLRLKAEMEAREAERCMEEMLRRNNLQAGSLHPRDADHQKPSDHARRSGREDTRQRYGSSQENSQKSAAGPERHDTAVIPGGPAEFSAKNYTSERSCDHTDPATDSTSKWSEVSEYFGASGTLGRFTLEIAQQYLREEELRARHQSALLRLREEALREKTKAELALLGHQRAYWEMKKERTRVEEIVRQEEEIRVKLKQEQAEIRHLHNMYKAAHGDRKLLLKQEKELRHIQQSATDIHHKLRQPEAAVQISGGSDRGVSRNQEEGEVLVSVTSSPGQRRLDTESAISHLSAGHDITDRTLKESTERTRTGVEDQSLDRSEGPPDPPKDSHSSLGPNQRAMCGSAAGQDGGEESNLLSENSPVTRRLRGSPTNRRPETVTWREDPSSRSQEKTRPANEEDPALPVPTQEPHHRPARHDGKKMEKQEQKTQTPPENLNALDQLKELSVMSSERETPQDAKWKPEANRKDKVKLTEAEESSQAARTAALLPSISEFHKVSATLIHISESSASFSDRGQDGQDTESGDSDVFDVESTGRPADESTIAGDLLEGSANLFEENFKNIGCDFKEGQSKEEAANLRAVSALEESENKKAPLASESFSTSEDVTESDCKAMGGEPLPEYHNGNTVSVTGQHESTRMGPEGISNVSGMTLSDTKERARVTETNAKQSFTENVIFGKIETAPLQTAASKDLFQIKSFPHPSEGEVIFIMEEVLQPVEDTLSEIFSPLDEQLSCESEDLFFAKQDQSEELPPLPRDRDSVNSQDTDTEDFPAPPEEIFFSGSGSLQSSREASLIEEIHLLYDNLLTEDALLQTSELVHQFPKGGNLDHCTGQSEDKRNVGDSVKQRNPFLTLSKAEDDLQDPMLTFEVGDRVLVKLSKPGTLKYKGLVSFREGYWAGVALDKAEGDNDGAYEGIRYFECPENCGVFVQPGEISHLLFDDQASSDPSGGNNNSPSEGPSPGNIRPSDQAGSKNNKERQSSKKRKSASGKDLNQAKECFPEPSGATDHITMTDPSNLCPHDIHIQPLNVETGPGQALQMTTARASDTDQLMLPPLLQGKRQTLVIKVTDELLKRLFCDVSETLTNITDKNIKTDKVMTHKIISYEESGEKYDAVYKRAHKRLPIAERLEISVRVGDRAQTFVMEAIKERKSIKINEEKV